MNLKNSFFCEICICIVVGALLFTNSVWAQANPDDGEGIDSQLIWITPGPSNFITIQSSDIIDHKGVSFGTFVQHYRKPLGIEFENNDIWVVKHASNIDFLWAFGLMDLFQFGLILPVTISQSGKGASLMAPVGANIEDYHLAGSAIKDIKLHIKTRFIGGNAKISDRRNLGLAFDLGLSVPTGDELNFAGENGMVFAPNAIFDFHRCQFSASFNVGARIRSEKATLAFTEVGHQLTSGLGVTGHYLDRTLLISAEGNIVAELADLNRLGFEYRATFGYLPDDAKAVTLWLSGGSGISKNTLLGISQMRFLFGITYAPK